MGTPTFLAARMGAPLRRIEPESLDTGALDAALDGLLAG